MRGRPLFSNCSKLWLKIIVEIRCWSSNSVEKDEDVRKVIGKTASSFAKVDDLASFKWCQVIWLCKANRSRMFGFARPDDLASFQVKPSNPASPSRMFRNVWLHKAGWSPELDCPAPLGWGWSSSFARPDVLLPMTEKNKTRPGANIVWLTISIKLCGKPVQLTHITCVPSRKFLLQILGEIFQNTVREVRTESKIRWWANI